MASRPLPCSLIQTKFRGESHGTWRAIYEQKIVDRYISFLIIKLVYLH